MNLKPSMEKMTLDLETIRRKKIISGGKSVKNLSYNQIKKATNNFSKLLDDTGGNGKVYRGTLDDGTEVAIKCPIECNGNDTEINHITNEKEIHDKVEHSGIVHLVGYHHDHRKPCIVYEYMPKGSLFNILHGGPHQGATFLTWPPRLNIAYQIAECLDYLHNYSNPKIIHADVKSANILLDDDLNAKLSDFGHSKTIESETFCINIPAEGTPHLIDPYWRETKRLTVKTDVYCFGILLVELLTSQKPRDLKRSIDGTILVENKKLEVEIDPKLREDMRPMVWDQMMEIVPLAINCMGYEIEKRPSMKEVAKQIQHIRNLDGDAALGDSCNTSV